MNKAELVDAIAAETQLTKAESRKALDAFLKVTSGSLHSGERVALVGFGTFSIAERKARKGRNPRTGEEISIPGRKVVKFQPGKELSDNVK